MNNFNLRVIIFFEDDVWYAQGLDIDYIAQGSSVTISVQPSRRDF